MKGEERRVLLLSRGGSVPGHGRVFARASTLVHN